MTTIRPLTPGDLPEVTRIYNHAVRNTTATLDTDEKTVADMAGWLDHHDDRYRAIGLEHDGRLIGYGCLSPFASRGGYRVSAEISIYVAPESHGAGIGRQLCAWLSYHAEEAGFTTVLGLTTSTNTASIRMLEAVGYVPGGALTRIGRKHGELIDLAIYQRFYERNIDHYLQGGDVPRMGETR
ncbi:N-acetyltransferase [Micromonospora sp. ALFpr18c]|uniref:GNAT family N-acetyltransferase n=1 Tax=Micromonospora sp. ALFpr18c TaxID=1458665 RepID=UPI00124B9390|nr:GNAT family N-acetyltransferase [Micromonospora sp. ALFpr18c]KAB1935296.1 N-acetyltransferase [Micromonospora sp. ALFpr18c]